MLSWLFGEPTGAQVREVLASAELVLSSELTLIESDRALIRAEAQGLIAEAQQADLHATLDKAAAHWIVFRVDSEVTERARRSFPVEPIRTLDALHLATALAVRALVPGVTLLTLDRRVRDSGRALGFTVLPWKGRSPYGISTSE